MRALVLRNEPHTLKIEDSALPALKEGEAKVRMMAASLNHRDQWIREGKYAKIQYPVIPGSDGCGIVESVAHPEYRQLIGQRVVINPNINWGSNPKAQSNGYSILGMPSAGTFAEYTFVQADRLHPVPKHLAPELAAALPLAGMTAYRAAITQGQCQAQDTVLITGIGGGVALFAMQFALATGARVFVTSSSDEKLQKAKELGAAGGVNYRTVGWAAELNKIAGGFDLILDSAGGLQMNLLLNLVKAGGSIVSYGATLGIVPEFDIRKIFWKQIRLQGSTMGTDADFTAMLAFVAKHGIIPIVDSIRPFDDIISAFDRMKEAKQFGKLVVKF